MADFKHSLGFSITSEGALAEPTKFKNTGYQAGWKLPAPHFNWIVDKTSKCITEIQQTHNALETQFKSALGMRNLHTYTSLSQIGLSGKVTMEDIFGALNMRGQCMLILGNTNADGTGNYVSDTPTQFGTLVVTHYAAARTMAQFWKADDGNVHQYIGKYHTTEGWSGWFETYTEAHKPTAFEVGAQGLHYYYDPTQFGCTTSTSLSEVWSKLPDMSIFVFPAVNMTHTSWNLPVGYGIMRLEKYNINRGSIHYFAKDNGGADYRMYLNNADGSPSGVWVKVYDEAHKPTASEVRAVPIGYGFADVAKDISNDALVNILVTGKSGFYMGVNVTGAPHSEQWWIFEVICHNTKFSSVMAYSVNGTDVFRMSYINNVFGSWHKVFTSADIIEVKNGGTGGATVPDAREGLNFISSTYTGTGKSGESGNRMYNYDTGARGSNLVFIANANSRGFLTPLGGVMFKDSGGLLSPGVYEVFGGNAGSKAYYSDGYIQLRTNHDFINFEGGVYHYWCL